jgi:undecaprenyl diphosphate synthase
MSMQQYKNNLPISSTILAPEFEEIPRHIAIIMDGNGRWAEKKKLPRNFGHERGVASLKKTVKNCLELNIKYLTVFAFSSENWRRPESEISFLMFLFKKSITKEIENLKNNGIRLRILGDIEALSYQLQDLILEAESSTKNNNSLSLNVAINYGGKWDILQAIRKMLDFSPDLASKNREIREEDLSPFMQISDIPEPDLFIRTGGEKRLSNFLLWQLTYTEFYFTDVLWPEFRKQDFLSAIESYKKRERRFGRTPSDSMNSPKKTTNDIHKNKEVHSSPITGLLDSFESDD